jgi:hypothetical protein
MPKFLWDLHATTLPPNPKPIRPDPKWAPAAAQEQGHFVKFTAAPTLPVMPMPPALSPAKPPAPVTKTSGS